jgi:hypothetical protein
MQADDKDARSIDAAEVDALVQAACAAAVPYPAQVAASPAKMDAASGAIAEGVVKRLAAMAAGGGGNGNGNGVGSSSSAARHKFVVSVHLSQASGAGLHVAAAHRLDPRTDGRVVVSWQGGGGGGGGGGGNGSGGGVSSGDSPDGIPPLPAPPVLDALVTVFYVAI